MKQSLLFSVLPNKSSLHYTALILMIIGGFFLLSKADVQARDTIRKHHLEDIEHSLYFARAIHGTYPPYEEPTWCGNLSDPNNREVRDQVEEVLRQQNEKYSNEEKPFPLDPLFDEGHDYFYWKRSPATFELYAILENDTNGERSTALCEGEGKDYDYGITSIWRETL